MKLNIIEIFNKIAPTLYEYDDSYKSRKYTEAEYFQEVLNYLRSECYWSRHNGLINGKVLNNKHNFFVNIGLYDAIKNHALDIYFKKCKATKLKNQSIDTSFIPNKLGCHNIGRNKYYKGKRGIKICSIVDSYGIPISTILTSGNTSDCKIFSELFDKMYIDPETNKYVNNNKYKQHFLADPGFDTKEIIDKLELKGYDVIIPQNIRNTKDQKKIRTLSKRQEKQYKWRLKVENSYSWTKAYPVLNAMYEKKDVSYLGLLNLSHAYLILNRLNKYPNGIV